MLIPPANTCHNPDLSEHLSRLAWCISSPSLLNSNTDLFQSHQISTTELSEDELEHFTNYLQRDKSDPKLDDWLSQCGSKRLGHLFEAYWHYYW